MSYEKLRFVFLNGKGSSGKDTQAEIISSKDKKAIRISTGEIYRGAKTPDGEFGAFYELLAPYIEGVDHGNFLPDEVMLEIVGLVIERLITEGKTLFIFTGFPRTLAQLDGVNEMLESLRNKYEIEAQHVYLAVLDSHSRLRAENRRKSLEISRQDDEPEIVERRLATFR